MHWLEWVPKYISDDYMRYLLECWLPNLVIGIVLAFVFWKINDYSSKKQHKELVELSEDIMDMIKYQIHLMNPNADLLVTKDAHGYPHFKEQVK